KSAGQVSLMAKLIELVEGLYSNNFLVTVNNKWQEIVDESPLWEAQGVHSQRHFFEVFIRPYLTKGTKVFVIISDALRYEIGEELTTLIRQENRYEAKIEPALSVIPSFTQLGMAALLPNKELRLASDNSGTVYVDEISSLGTVNRNKILKQALAGRGTAIKADVLLGLNRDEARSLAKDNDVVYVYHNRIDAAGDKRETEETVFEAAEKTLDELVRIIKKVASANVSHFIVTADHGFLYQNSAIDDSDFCSVEAIGEDILYRDRRFVLGKGLVEQPALRKFLANQIGLAGDVELQVPKSVSRLRLKGSGSRFVHGGCSLQEVVIPVIQVSKKRTSDLSSVEVEILRTGSSVITSGQLAVTFYQVQPIDEKTQAITLRAGLYSQGGDLISDCHELRFDSGADSPREREMQVRFILSSNTDNTNGQEAILKLDELVLGTSHYREHKSIRYTIRRSFTSDFDF
ncbi:MAG: BREX-1 system phosphatase PglZ type A, partial [Candidatus Obscuribacterales bacterium]|nr:BREX-1 system phosphatase PglZ type A [Candidatus Obscuribacterales bacterium]